MASKDLEGHTEIEAIDRNEEALHDPQGIGSQKNEQELATQAQKSKEELANEPEFPQFDDMPALKVGVILISLGLAMFLLAIEQTIVATSVSTIGAALNIKDSLTWISTSYLLTTTIVQPIIGRIADAVGVKRLLIIELWIFVIGNIIVGSAKGLGQLIAGRLISGIGGAGLLSLICIAITQLTHERQRASYMNLINVVFIFADSLGPIVGGAFASSGNWRWIFLMNAPFGPVITIILVFALQLPRISSPIRTFRDVLTKVDIMGMFLIVSCLSFLVIALNSGGQTVSWSSPMIIGLFCAGGVTFILFWIAESRAKMPVAPTRLFAKWEWRNVPISMIARTLLFFHLFSITFYLPVFLQVTGVSSIIASALVIPFLIMAAIASTACNELASRTNNVRLVYVGGLLILPVGLGLLSTLDETSSLGKIVGYSLLAGAGFGSGTQLSMVIAQVGVPADELSTVTALIGSAPSLGGTLGLAVIGTVVNNVFRGKVYSSPEIIDYASRLDIHLNANDAVDTVRLFAEGSVQRQAAVKAYVIAWQRGMWTLVGVAGVNIVLSLILKKIELQAGKKQQVEAEREQASEAQPSPSCTRSSS